MPKEVVNIDFGFQITQRFLFAIDRIIGNRTAGKVTQESLGTIIGISSSNINRLRKDPDRRITIDACGKLCHHYKVSAHWLLTGKGEPFSNNDPQHKTIEQRLNDLEMIVKKRG